MALPGGIATFTVNFGSALTYMEGDPVAMDVTVTAPFSLVWTATGQPIIANSKSVHADAGTTGTITLIDPGQDGFTDGQGNEIRDWSYLANITYVMPNGDKILAHKQFGHAEGMPTTYDLDTALPLNVGGTFVFIPGSWRFTFRGEWAPSTAYKAFDVLTHGGSTYEASADFTSGSTFSATPLHLWAAKGDTGDTGATGSTGLTGDTGAAGAGFLFRGAWAASTAYAVGDVVTNGGQTYEVTTAHTSPGSFSTTNLALWAAKGTDGASFTYRGAWAGSTAYAVNDVVTNGGQAYIVTTAHTSPSSFSTTNLSLLAAKGTDGANGADGTGFSYRGAWAASTAYLVRDVVTYNGQTYIVLTGFTSSSSFDATNLMIWAASGQGLTIKGAWAASTAYAVNDVVTVSGSAYVCLTAHTSSSTFPGIGSNWALLSRGISVGTTAPSSPQVNDIWIDAS